MTALTRDPLDGPPLAGPLLAGQLTLAADLGSSRVKVGLVAADGTVLDHTSRPGPVSDGRAGRSEFDADHWWHAFGAGTAELAARSPAEFARVVAICIGGVTRTQVLLDAGGRPVMPAIGLADTRADTIARALAARLPPAHPETSHINAFHPLARLAWLAAEMPETLARATAVVDPKDYVAARLTGRIASDRISLWRLAAAVRPDADGRDLMAASGVARSLLPPLLAPGDTVGRVSAGLPGAWAGLAGLPVVCGCHDTWMAVLGLGAMRPGYAYLISGTTEVLGAIAAEPVPAEGLLTVDWGDGLAQIGGPCLNGADTLVWIASLLAPTRDRTASPPDDDTSAALATLLQAPRRAQPVLFLPFLRGERVPYWDPGLRGAFLGLAREHGAADLAWAVLEGLACVNREVLSRAETATGMRVGEVRLAGGGARLDLVAQIKADILDRPVVTAASSEPGLAGAGILAAASLGGDVSVSALAAAQAAIPTGRSFAPDPRRRAAGDALFALFTDAHAAVLPLSHRLAAMTVAP